MVPGLTNGVSYECQVAAIGAAAEGSWTAATTAVAPMGRPQPPAKPSIQALDGAVQIGVAGNGSPDVSAYRYECSGDGGATWTSTVDAGTVDTTAQITHLTNGVQYVCRAYAANAVGLSEPSALSDAAMPCGSVVDCDPLLRSLVQPILILLGVLLRAGSSRPSRRCIASDLGATSSPWSMSSTARTSDTGHGSVSTSCVTR